MLKVKVFEAVPEAIIEDKISQWMHEVRMGLNNYASDIEIVSTSQSQDGVYVTLTVFYRAR